MKRPRLIPTNINKPKTYGPLGKCLYCEKLPPEVTLSKEHIIPLGLGSGAIFLKASCEECRKITHQFETKCLREDLLPFRTHNKFPTRRPKERPKQLAIRANPQVPNLAKLVSIEDHPNLLTLPQFKEPGILVGGDPNENTIAYRLLH